MSMLKKYISQTPSISKECRNLVTMFSETCDSWLFKESGTLGSSFCIATQSETFDKLLGAPGVCGINKTMITEFCGFNSSGKTQMWWVTLTIKAE